MATGFGALAAPTRPGETPTARQQACSLVALRVGDAYRHMPELRGGAVQVDPTVLGRELRASHGKAQELLSRQSGAPGGASPEIVAAETALREAVGHAALIEAQDAKTPPARAATRNKGKAGTPAEPDADVLPEEVLRDPELAGSDDALHKELISEGFDPADPDVNAQQSVPAQPERGRPAPTGKPPLVRVGTVSTGKPGEVFNISSLPADAPRERPTPTDSRPPRAGPGVRSWSRHARTQHSSSATAVTRARVNKKGIDPQDVRAWRVLGRLGGMGG